MLNYQGLSEPVAIHYKSEGADAYGLTPEHSTSDGVGKPCRRCLRNVPEGKGMLILAHRPFDDLHAYAETGPIFLCAEPCEPADSKLPPILTTSPEYLVKGYGHDMRIVYGTGAIVLGKDIPQYAQSLLDRPDITFVDVRSARNNCWLVRIMSA